jgi:hypothetical protein
MLQKGCAYGTLQLSTVVVFQVCKGLLVCTTQVQASTNAAAEPAHPKVQPMLAPIKRSGCALTGAQLTAAIYHENRGWLQHIQS